MPEYKVPTNAKNVVNSVNYLDQSFYYSGSDVKCYCNGTWIDELSYIQITPQQQIVPIYNIFQKEAIAFIHGNTLIKGVLGLNFVYANYLEELGNIYGQDKTVVAESEGCSIFFEQLTVEFQNMINNHIPTIELNKVYLSGGVISPSVDGNPIQVIYQFIARSMKKRN